MCVFFVTGPEDARKDDSFEYLLSTDTLIRFGNDNLISDLRPRARIERVRHANRRDLLFRCVRRTGGGARVRFPPRADCFEPVVLRLETCER